MVTQCNYFHAFPRPNSSGEGRRRGGLLLFFSSWLIHLEIFAFEAMTTTSYYCLCTGSLVRNYQSVSQSVGQSCELRYFGG